MLVIIPFWTNSLIRIYGWRSFLGTNGWLNSLLQALHLTDTPVDFLFHQGTTVLGMVYCLFPFMVLPLYTAIEKLDQSLLEASSDLGAKGPVTFFPGGAAADSQRYFFRLHHGFHSVPGILLCVGHSGRRKRGCDRKSHRTAVSERK